MKNIIKTAALAYIAVSLLLSVIVSGYILPPCEVITRRAPFLVLELSCCTIAGTEPDGHIYGYDVGGGYVGFGHDTDAFPVGSKAVTLFVWNPLNSFCDDIVARYDLFVLR